ncbi:MAG: hypothetical protein CVU03_03495 [Bacteroidetes bacterium HGW-Bacteroidetes-2]|jgi:hypothetical protein|nr:MAG: hypothetical protein CVU03_03495 [Bacteroidetes bacterium HGW-Bacteroidetes-2]
MNFDITLKVTNLQLVEAFAIILHEPPEIGLYATKDQRRMRHLYSLWADLRSKLGKKVLNNQGNQKQSSLKLKYYEAATLHQILGLYDKPSYAQQLYDQLDQKLA